tara:strand:- start:1552 stop:1692 length:141 start_codon:yes stop_codon:yes gene_type:complete
MAFFAFGFVFEVQNLKTVDVAIVIDLKLLRLVELVQNHFWISVKLQ